MFESRIDQELQESLNSWEKQIDFVFSIEEKFFQLEATEDSLFGMLFLKTIEGSIKEKEAIVNNSSEWRNFQNVLAVKKAEYLKQKRLLEIKAKHFDACYLSFKINSERVKRG